MDDEFDFHLQNEVAENVRRGMSADEALAAARRRFGGVAQTKEAYREAHSLPFFQVLWQDLRFGFRMLRRNPGFSILAILCLTLGIGATTAVFSWIEGVLLRPFPLVAHQERMMAVAGTYRGVAGAPGTRPICPGRISRISRRTASFSTLSSWIASPGLR